MSFPRVGIGALIPTFSEDIVAIFEQSESGDDVQVLTNAHLMRAKIDENVTFYKHPLENGRSIVDHRIIQPVTLDIQLILTDKVSIVGALLNGGDIATRAKDVYGDARALWIAGTLLAIQTRTNTYPNQIIQAMPHEESPQMFDGVTINFRTSEIQFETANVTFSPREASDSDTIGRGKQNPLTVAADTASAVLSEAVSIFGG